MLPQKVFKNRAVAGLIIGILICVLLMPLMVLGVFNGLHLKLADRLYTRNEPSKDIIIIAIDDKSTIEQPEGLGRFSRWSRQNYTNILSLLDEEKPKVISFDIVFSNYTEYLPYSDIRAFINGINKDFSDSEKVGSYEEFLGQYYRKRENPDDQSLAEKLSKFDNIVLAFNGNPLGAIFPIAKFSQHGIPGDTYVNIDEDGVFRSTIPRKTLDGEDYDDFALATVKKYLGKEEIDLPLRNDRLLVNYFADPYGYQMVPFVNVLKGNYEKGIFKDKIVLIGLTTFREIDDVNLTPRSNEIPMPGVEIWANEIQTILDGKFLLNQTKTAKILTVAGVAIAVTIALNYLGIFTSIIITIFALLAYLGAAHLAYRKGLILNMVYPFLAIVMTYLGSWVYKYFIADRNKREITSAFGHYVSKELVDQISKNPDMVKLGGEKKVVTVFFSDIRDSTGWSEKIPTEQWVAQMNEYFTVMEFVLKSYGGTLDKYEGDAIMGFWNAPITQPDHVMRGYLTAIAMRKALKKLHEKWQKEGRPLIEFRIGINTGEAIVGNFGSASRFDYTVMGDTVNTASRLESSANKTYGTFTIVAGFEGQVSDEALAKVVLRELDTVLLPGKKEAVGLFELVCLADDCNDNVRGMLKTYADGLAAYRRKDFGGAATAFESLKDDPAALVMLARCKKLQAGESVSGLDGNMVFAILNK